MTAELRNKKLAVILGVRPHYIKAAALSFVLEQSNIDLQFVDVHQHYDEDLRGVHINEFDLEVHHTSEVRPDTSGPFFAFVRQIADIGTWLQSRDGQTVAGVMVLGDANPALAGAIAANRLEKPVIHLEAGVRRVNSEQEHWNSCAVDHLSCLRYCYTASDLNALQREGLSEGSWLVGDVLAPWLLNRAGGSGSSPHSQVETSSNLTTLVSIHRPQNCNLDSIVTILDELEVLGTKVTWLLHPRVAPFAQVVKSRRFVTALPPQGHGSVLNLLSNSQLVVTDSGGLVREGVLLERKVVVCHEHGMWESLVTDGAIARSSITAGSLRDAVRQALFDVDPAKGKKHFLLDGGLELFRTSLEKFLEG